MKVEAVVTRPPMQEGSGTQAATPPAPAMTADASTHTASPGPSPGRRVYAAVVADTAARKEAVEKA